MKDVEMLAPNCFCNAIRCDGLVGAHISPLRIFADFSVETDSNFTSNLKHRILPREDRSESYLIKNSNLVCGAVIAYYIL